MFMIESIRKFIHEHDLDCSQVLIALSGGADSVSLIYAFNELRDELELSLEACHINHMLRGADSDNDEAFVRKLCERLDVRLHVRRIDVKARQKKHQSLEEAAREARYSCLDMMCTNGYIATAHTANDNTETVLLNLIRGTALRGLCGIPAVRRNIIRPMLGITRNEVLAYLESRNAAYVTDLSNSSDDFTRNNLRLNVMPLLEELNPSLNAGVTRMCESLRLDEEYIGGIARDILIAAENNGAYRLDVLNNTPQAVKSRIIAMILSQNNISPSNLRISQIASLLTSKTGKVNLKKHRFVVVKRGLLTIETIHQNYR